LGTMKDYPRNMEKNTQVGLPLEWIFVSLDCALDKLLCLKLSQNTEKN
jgi:hypothetical protein